MQGWMNYFGIAEYYRPILGTNKRHAILSALSRKRYWHMSGTLAIQSGMTSQWSADQGLVSIKKLWSVVTLPCHGSVTS
ncbi:MAG: hypothetical protein COA36_10575 [Desulfotalea sp.]|nr:MAG: hypothetical protein COA36_10575 [Desulfotalea sp.]